MHQGSRKRKNQIYPRHMTESDVHYLALLHMPRSFSLPWNYIYALVLQPQKNLFMNNIISLLKQIVSKYFSPALLIGKSNKANQVGLCGSFWMQVWPWPTLEVCGTAGGASFLEGGVGVPLAAAGSTLSRRPWLSFRTGLVSHFLRHTETREGTKYGLWAWKACSSS